MLKIIKTILPFCLATAFFLILLTFSLSLTYEKMYENKTYPFIFVAGINVSGMTKNEIKTLFENKKPLSQTKHFIFNLEGKEWATNSTNLKFKFNAEKMAEKAIAAKRNSFFLKKIFLIAQKEDIKAEYVVDKTEVDKFISKIQKDVKIEPEDALFSFNGAKVSAFKFAKNGQKADENKIKKDIWQGLFEKNNISKFEVKTITVLPKIGNQDADKLGIKELLGTGVSYFYDSIPSRIFNIELAASKFNGVLIKPGETFSFLKTVGPISKLEGYKEAYVISNGKTVLGDGGGVCQVSTTLYRAALYSGLPIVERTPHSYRVPFYEPPLGMDATIYQPSGPDLKFKNNTPAHILIQTFFDAKNMSLTFWFYGTSDGRVTQISDPVVVSTSPPPPTKYQDDPNLPKGVEKQIDTAHSGAKVYFTRKVTRGNQTLIDEKIWSNFVPWAAVILRGTKE